MTRFVVDASVAVKWVLPEIHDNAARTLLDDDNELLAPEFLLVEIGSALWKRVRREGMAPAKGAAAIQALKEIGLAFHPTTPLMDAAFELACRLPHNVYDCVYAALAMDRDCPMVTADQAFHNLAQRSGLADRVLWIGDLPR